MTKVEGVLLTKEEYDKLKGEIEYWKTTAHCVREREDNNPHAKEFVRLAQWVKHYLPDRYGKEESIVDIAIEYIERGRSNSVPKPEPFMTEDCIEGNCKYCTNGYGMKGGKVCTCSCHQEGNPLKSPIMNTGAFPELDYPLTSGVGRSPADRLMILEQWAKKVDSWIVRHDNIFRENKERV